MIRMQQMFGRDDVIACWIDREYINANSGFFKQVVIGRDEYAVVIVNGKVKETITEGKLKGLSGGIINRLANWLGGGEDFQIVWVDAAPRDITMPFKGMSLDRIEINGTCTFRFRIVPEEADKVVRLMRGRWLLTIADVKERLGGELVGSIIAHIVNKHTASEFHENADAVRTLDERFLGALRATWTPFGIELMRLAIGWDKNEYDRAMELSAAEELRQKEADIRFAAQIGDKKREETLRREKERFEHETRIQFEQHGYDYNKLQKEHKFELEKMDAEFRRGMEYADVLEKEKIKTTQLAKEIERMEMQYGLEDKRWEKLLERERKQWKENMEKALDTIKIKEADWIVERTRLTDLVNIWRDMRKTKMEEYERHLQAYMKGLEIEADVRKHEATMAAEAEKSKLETYKEALKEERDYQIKLKAYDVEMVKAARGETPHTLVQGSTQPAVSVVQFTPEERVKKKKKRSEEEDEKEPRRIGGLKGKRS